MTRFYLVKLTNNQSKVVFWIGDFAAGCALFLLMLVLISAPYPLGLLPETVDMPVGGPN